MAKIFPVDTLYWPKWSRFAYRLRPMLFLTLMIIVVPAAPRASEADILDELRLGQHFDREQIFQSGPDVLAEALAGNSSSVSLLAMYFENGERGFPADASVAKRLYQKAYDMGEWTAALSLAESAEHEQDFKRAAQLYWLVFLVASEENQRRLYDRRNYGTDGRYCCLDEPGFTHTAYAGIQHLIRSGAVSTEDLANIDTESRSEAVKRGFFADCEGRARTECNAVSDSYAAASCRVDVEERCLSLSLQ